MVLVSFAVSLISRETHTDNGIIKNWEANMIVDIQSSRYDSCPAVNNLYKYIYQYSIKRIYTNFLNL